MFILFFFSVPETLQVLVQMKSSLIALLFGMRWDLFGVCLDVADIMRSAVGKQSRAKYLVHVQDIL